MTRILIFFLGHGSYLFMKACKLFTSAYVDAKVGTLSAWSWPTRELAHKMADERFSDPKCLTAPFVPFQGKKDDHQYLNPTQHAYFVKYLANHGRRQLARKLSRALAVWCLQDGSVDITQVDNYFHILRMIDENGKLETVFLSLEEKLGYGAQGQLETLKQSLCSVYPDINEINKDVIIDLLLKRANEDCLNSDSDQELEDKNENLMAESIGGFGEI